jgi:ADP-heptose:LPS heptosyltransferase
MAGAREFAHLFYTDKIQQVQSDIHLVDYYLKMAEAAGAKRVDIEFKLPEDTEAAEAVKKLLKSQGVSLDKYFVIIPGAARPEKIWPLERFAQLADKIVSRFGGTIVATGSRGEREYIERFKAAAKSNVVNLAGQTSLRELTALLKGAKLVISNDTGPGHIAAALGVPIVMIFGPTNPARLHPYKKPESIAGTDPKAMGMKMESFDPKYSIHHITVEQVFEKICKQIEH